MVRKVRETMRAVREGGPSHVRGRWRVVAVQLSVKLNSKEFQRALRKNAEQWPKAVNSTLSDMRRRAPTIIGRTAAETYNIAATRLNPNNKTSRGSVSLSGGLQDLSLIYRGPGMPIKSFKKALDPTSMRRNKAPYKVTAEYVRGKRTIIGHWSPPGTEGGRYSGKSPRMYIPGVHAYGPVQREGRGWGGGNFGPSVPQMVINRGNGEREIEQLSKLMGDRLEHHLRRFGLM